MSRLDVRIAAARKAVLDAESILEDLEDKKRRANFKRNRKRLRKKLVSDPTYRMMARMERQLYKVSLGETYPFRGLMSFLDDEEK